MKNENSAESFEIVQKPKYHIGLVKLLGKQEASKIYNENYMNSEKGMARCQMHRCDCGGKYQIKNHSQHNKTRKHLLYERNVLKKDVIVPDKKEREKKSINKIKKKTITVPTVDILELKAVLSYIHLDKGYDKQVMEALLMNQKDKENIKDFLDHYKDSKKASHRFLSRYEELDF